MKGKQTGILKKDADADAEADKCLSLIGLTSDVCLKDGIKARRESMSRKEISELK